MSGPHQEAAPAGAPAPPRPRRRVPRAPAERIQAPRELVAGVLLRLPSVRELTPSQKTLLIFLCETILHRRGAFVQGQGELAAELNVSRRTIIRAVARLRELRLLEAKPTIQHGTGGTDKLRYRIHRSIYGLFIGCDMGVTPLPEGFTEENFDVPTAGDVERRSGAPTAPEQLFGRLAATFTDPDRVGRADLLVMKQLAGTLPGRYWRLALDLARKAADPSGASIGAPGAWIRQRLADRIRAEGSEPPASWRVRPTPEAELHRIRTQLGLRRRPAVATAAAPIAAAVELPTIPARPRRSRAGDAAPRRVDPPPPASSSSSSAHGVFAGHGGWRSLLSGGAN